MPLPASLTLIPVHVKVIHTDADGTPSAGDVFFDMPYALRDAAGGVVLGRRRFRAKLVNGEATINLPATDDPDLSPQNWTYTVTPVTDAWADPPFEIEVPYDTVGTLELAELAPAVSPTAVATYSLLGHSHTLDALTDVNVAAATNGQVLGRVGGVWVGVVGGGGITDHGALDGLGDDDHPHYLNNARGDARYSLLAHNHTAAILAYAVPNPVSRWGCVAMTMTPHDMSDFDPKTLALTQNRLLALWVDVPVGVVLGGVRFPLQAVASGAGAVQFDIYQQDLTRLGSTGDVGAALKAGAGATWRTHALTAPAAVTGDGVWITAFSSCEVGPNLIFADTNVEGWLYNPADRKAALRIDGTTAPGGTLDLTGAVDYLDVLIGVTAG